MPMPPTDQQEQFSLAALHAICAGAGFAWQPAERIGDGWGYDVTVTADGPLPNGGQFHDPTLRFQVRATKQQHSLDDRGHSFPLDRKTYDRLRSTNRTIPFFLAVYQMPREEEQWLTTTPESLVLRRCLRFLSLYGAPEVEQGNVTVKLPDANVLDVAALVELARVTSHGERIIHADDV